MNAKSIIILALAVIAISTLATAGQPVNDVNINIDTNATRILSRVNQIDMDTIYHGATTNGLSCDVEISRRFSIRAGQNFPACNVYIFNKTTNNLNGFLKLPIEALYQIELFDVAGKPVKKSEAGAKYLIWSEQQVCDWVVAQSVPNQIYGDWEYFRLPANEKRPHNSFGISNLFELKQPGEFTLHFKMRLLKNVPSSTGLHYATTWLPDVVAKVQIRPEDIPLAN